MKGEIGWIKAPLGKQFLWNNIHTKNIRMRKKITLKKIKYNQIIENQLINILNSDKKCSFQLFYPANLLYSDCISAGVNALHSIF